MLAHREQPPVVPAQPNRGLPVAAEQQDDVLVLLADQHHLRHLDGGGIGDAQAVHELDPHPESLHVGRDVRPAPVHHHGIHPDVLEQHDVARELLLELLVDHRGAAVLDDHRATMEVADVGERLEESGDVAHQPCPFTYLEL
jgi:hypothetical protein